MIDHVQKLKSLIKQIKDLEKNPNRDSEFSVWHKAVIRTLKGIFGEDDEHVKQFEKISFSLRFVSSLTTNSKIQEAYIKGLETSKLLLEDFLTEIPKEETNSEINDCNPIF